MKEQFKKCLSLLTAILMLLCLIPFQTLAEAVFETQEQKQTEHADSGSISSDCDNIHDEVFGEDTSETYWDMNNMPLKNGHQDTENDFPKITYVSRQISNFSEESIWDGSIAENYAGGMGTEADPYLISNGSELALLAQQVNSGIDYAGSFFEMTADIYLNDITGWENWGTEDADGNIIAPANEWTAIGRLVDDKFVDTAFSGNFNGNGHVVFGMYTNKNGTTTHDNHQALFGKINGGSLINLGVEAAYVHGFWRIAGIAGYNNGLIANCYNKGSIDGIVCAAGIVGENFSKGRILDCSNIGKISGEREIGGVVSKNSNSVINCCNMGTVNGETDGTGGIAALNFETILKCYNTGAVNGISEVGGIAGNNPDGAIKYCINKGDITASTGVGGLIGNNGQCDGEVFITDCYNTGDVSGSVYVGGIIGATEYLSTVANCYSAGTVVGNNNTGGIAGDNCYVDEADGQSHESIITNCYYLDTGCADSNTYGTALTDSQMQNASSFAGFDFEMVWTMEGEPDYPYPELNPKFEVVFYDGYTHDVIPGGYIVEAGTVLNEADFPAPPVHPGCEFVDWDYDGEPIYEYTVVKARYNNPDATWLNGYIGSDPSGTSKIWARFPEYDPETIENHGEMPATLAAAFAGGNVYGYIKNGSDTRFYTMNAETYEVTYSVYNADVVIYAMAYNHADGVMYAIGDKGSNRRAIYKVNLAIGTLEYVADIDANNQVIMTLAIDGEGNAYGLDLSNNSSLWSINLSNGICTPKGNTGIGLNYVQSMTWDHRTDKIFWAQYYNAENNGLYTIDPNTLEVKRCGTIGGGAEVTCLWIANDEPVAPIELPQFQITFIDGYTNEEIPGGYTVDGGTTLNTEDFPTPPTHEGCEFKRWKYSGETIFSDTIIKAIYSYPGAAELHAYLPYNPKPGKPRIWGDFAEYDTETVVKKSKKTQTFAAAYADGMVYGFLNYSGDRRFYKLDPSNNYKLTYTGYAPNCNVYAMAYDHLNGVMYALGAKDISAPRSIYKVNLALGVLEHVADVNAEGETIMTLAIDGSGNAYGVNAALNGRTAFLWSIDLVTGACTRIGDTGLGLNYVQSMTWDHNTDRLFWAQYFDADDNGLYVVDTETGAVSLKGKIGAGAQATCLWIANDKPVAPIEVPQYSITFKDGLTGDTISGYTMEGGTALNEADFPEPPIHEDYEFAGWDYKTGTKIFADTVITARYRNIYEIGFYFEDDPAAEGWTWEDRDGDGYNWKWMLNYPNMNVPEGNGMMNSESFNNQYGPLNPDNWLISPEVPGGGSVSFMLVGQDPAAASEVIGVYASTDGGNTWSGELGHFVTGSAIQIEVIDLSQFADQNIRIAFRHYNVTDQFSVNLDAVSVIPPPPERVPGDYDCDGDVDAEDVVLTLRAAMELITPSGRALTNADMDGDGKLTAADALTILRIDMNLL